MVSCFRVCVVGLPLILSIATIILSALSIAGQTKNANPINNIYMFQLDVSNATSFFDSSVSATSSSVFTFGMWGYCTGSTESDGSYSVTYCSKPAAMYQFDPLEALELILGSASITLPDSVTDYINTAQTVSKLIFITGLIGACGAFVTGVFTILSFTSHIMSCLAMIIGIISFLSTLICAAASTGTFSIVSKYFNNNFDTYGVSAGLGNKWFYAFIWASAASSMLAAFLNFWAMCCGSTSRSKSIEKQPLMEYREKNLSSDSD